MREIRYLDKLIDELAKGKAMEKILRGQEQPWKKAIKNFMAGSTQKINRIFIRLIFCVLLRMI